MTYLETETSDPFFNLAAEEYVFERLDPSRDYFMLWQNAPTVVVGRYQNTAEEVNRAFVEDNHIKVVRRLSGGGAVYHDKGNLNFTYVIKQEGIQPIAPQYFSLPIIQALEHFGVKAECTGRNDIMINGAKFSGNAQHLKGGRLLYHGCVMLDTDLSSLAGALNPAPEKYLSHGTKSLRARVTTINEHVVIPITMDVLKDTLRQCVFKGNPSPPHQFSAVDLAEIGKLRNEKYATWEWNYGESPDFSLKRQKKFPAGVVEVYLRITHSRIEAIRFFGDFFGSGDIHELEQAIEGLSLDDSLEHKLNALNIEYYMHGISSRNLADLLR